MFLNPNIKLTILWYVFIFIVGFFLHRKNLISRSIGMILIAIGFGLYLLFSGYYLHLIKTPIWYIEFRTIPFIEILVGTIGLSLGILTAQITKEKAALIFIIFAFGITLNFPPYIKNIINPTHGFLKGKEKDGVVLQSSTSTCGPSCLSTIFKQYNIQKTEYEIAQQAFTSGSSTEIWYLLRCAKANGLAYEISTEEDIQLVKTPAIVGTWLGDYGHFITLLNRENNILTVGDPLKGKLVLTPAQFYDRYQLDGMNVHFFTSTN